MFDGGRVGEFANRDQLWMQTCTSLCRFLPVCLQLRDVRPAAEFALV